jgi:hypothetical protein
MACRTAPFVGCARPVEVSREGRVLGHVCRHFYLFCNRGWSYSIFGMQGVEEHVHLLFVQRDWSRGRHGCRGVTFFPRPFRREPFRDFWPQAQPLWTRPDGGTVWSAVVEKTPTLWAVEEEIDNMLALRNSRLEAEK